MQGVALRCPLIARRWLAVVALGCVVLAVPVRAEVWGYVDDKGQAHLSDHQLDTRYALFFRGDAGTNSAASKAGPQAEPERAPALVQPAALRRYEQMIEQHA